MSTIDSSKERRRHHGGVMRPTRMARALVLVFHNDHGAECTCLECVFVRIKKSRWASEGR